MDYDLNNDANACMEPGDTGTVHLHNMILVL